MKSLLLAVFAAFCVLQAPHMNAEDSLPAALSPATQGPEIISVRGRTVVVRVPDGYGRVTLERLSGKVRGWTPFATLNCATTAGDVTFKIKTPVARRLLRASGQRQAPVPQNLLGGRFEFLAPKGFTPTTGDFPPESQYFAFNTAGGGVNLTGNALTLGSPVAADAAPRTVVEGDIWKLDGDRLYFFNQYRGLQVLDVSNPSAPSILGQLRMPVGGDEMYVFGNYAALLLPRWRWWHDSSPGSELVICSVAYGNPQEITRLPITGTPFESRLVGTALYVASNQSSYDSGTYKNVTVITGYDLADPANPVQRNSVEVVGPAEYSWARAVWSDERYFVSANVGYAGNETITHLNLVDVSSPDGTVTHRGKAVMKGWVESKFNMHARGTVLSAVSDYSRWDGITGTRVSYAHLENFDIANPDAPRSLGELDMGHGEMVRSTRYDSDRVYVVTAIRMDPLWIVNNANPARPQLVSHLEVPGWSTYIHPLGDRLVTVGVMPSTGASIWNTRVAVSLYDVANPARPKLLRQLPVGGNFSSSEANWDEKAFTVIPDAGLILVPYTNGYFQWRWDGWSEPGGAGIQLVDMGRDDLTLRGIIRHEFTPRRSAAHKGSILALSDRDLLSVDITNRDQPVVKADLELAWNVDLLWRSGDFLIQLDRGRNRYGYESTAPAPSLTISPANNPENSISVVSLGKDSVVGADIKDGLLTVLTRPGYDGRFDNTRQPVRLTVYDVTSLPQVVKKGSVVVRDKGSKLGWYSGDAQILWPTPGTLVAVVQDDPVFYYRPIFTPIFTITLFPGTLIGGTDTGFVASSSDSLFAPNYYRSTSSKRLIAFDVSNPRAPQHLSTVSLGKSYSRFGNSIATGGKIFTSRYEYRDRRYYLDVADFFTPGLPFVSEPISFPGELFASSGNGLVLYARGPDHDTDGNANSYYDTNSIHAVAYDGTRVHLLDSLSSKYQIPPVPVSGDNLFVPRYTEGPSTQRIESWRLGDDAKFMKLGEVPVSTRSWSIFSVTNDVLLESDQGTLHFWDITVPGALSLLDAGEQQTLSAAIENAIGSKAEGIFIPAGLRGVEAVTFP